VRSWQAFAETLRMKEADDIHSAQSLQDGNRLRTNVNRPASTFGIYYRRFQRSSSFGSDPFAFGIFGKPSSLCCR
jgi:hypothetical protein